MGFKNLVNRARSLATRNPDATRRVLDRVEGQINTRTGGKYRRQLSKGSDLLGQRLGMRNRNTRPGDLPPASGQPRNNS